MDYAHPEALVSTEWVAGHAADPNVRVVEVDVDTNSYAEGHVPGAIAWAWNTQLCDTTRRDILSKAQFEKLMGASGISNDTTVVLYGDNNNWFAAWALWQMKMYGHKDVRIMNGGRNMPAFASSLTPAEVSDLVAFLQSRTVAGAKD